MPSSSLLIMWWSNRSQPSLFVLLPLFMIAVFGSLTTEALDEEYQFSKINLIDVANLSTSVALHSAKLRATKFQLTVQPWERRQGGEEVRRPRSTENGSESAERFVSVNGSCFALGRRFFPAIGWNTYTLIEQAAQIPVGSFAFNYSCSGRRQVTDMFDAAVAAGFNTRLELCFGVTSRAYSVGENQSFQVAPGEYYEPLFQGLDWVIQQASLRDIKLILVFTDYWEYNGGVAQYLDWAGSRARTKNDFFSNSKCKMMYKNNIQRILERINTYTGVRYRHDKSIMAWELINEPRCRNCPEELQDWLEEMAHFVKFLDRTHLLSTGEEGFYSIGSGGSVDANPEVWSLTTGQDFVANHAIPEIDFAVAHLWPDNWGVFTLGLPASFSETWLVKHKSDSRAILGKPFLLEEFGTTGNGQLSAVDQVGSRFATTAERAPRSVAVAEFYRSIFKQVELDNENEYAIAGGLFWTWHHLDLQSVALPVDKYAIFHNDRVFTEVRRHARIMNADLNN